MAKVTNIFGKTLGRLQENPGKRMGWEVRGRVAEAVRKWGEGCAEMCGGLVYGCVGLRELGKRCSRTVGSQWGARIVGPEVTS
jgi:hypothetical protein